MLNAIGQFRDAIQSAGLVPPSDIEPDGKLRRFSSNGKKADDAGWYLLHDEGIPAGSFGDWRTGIMQTWRADIGRTLTHAEETAHRAKVEAMRREREAEEARRKSEAKTKAAAIWQTGEPAPGDHPYLTRKGIKANGAKLYNDALLIPMRADGDIHSLQFIGPDGEKRFLTGGRVKGCYFSIGNPKGAAALCIAEGFATGVGYSPQIESPENKKFVAAFREANKTDPDLYGADSYGLLFAYKAAVEKAGSTETDKVREALRGLTWQTPQGAKSIRAGDHQAMQPMYVVRVNKGKFDIIDTVRAENAIGPDACARF